MNAEAMKRESMAAALNAPPKGEVVHLTGEQLAVILVFEAQAAQLQIAANQLATSLGLTSAADVLISAKKHIEGAKVRMQGEWARTVVVAQLADVPRLVAP